MITAWVVFGCARPKVALATTKVADSFSFEEAENEKQNTYRACGGHVRYNW
jgi:hypothetical protein